MPDDRQPPHGRVRTEQHVTDPVEPNPGPLDRAAVARAVRDLDLADHATRRWYAAGGEAPVSAHLAHAFALASDVALALVDVATGGPRERTDRYVIPFVLRDGVVREAAEGDGAWRALAAAIAGGRTIPGMTRDGTPETPETDGGQVDAALVCRPSPGFVDASEGAADDVGSAAETPLGRAGPARSS